VKMSETNICYFPPSFPRKSPREVLNALCVAISGRSRKREPTSAVDRLPPGRRCSVSGPYPLGDSDPVGFAGNASTTFQTPSLQSARANISATPLGPPSPLPKRSSRLLILVQNAAGPAAGHHPHRSSSPCFRRWSLTVFYICGMTVVNPLLTRTDRSRRARRVRCRGPVAARVPR